MLGQDMQKQRKIKKKNESTVRFSELCASVLCIMLCQTTLCSASVSCVPMFFALCCAKQHYAMYRWAVCQCSMHCAVPNIIMLYIGELHANVLCIVLCQLVLCTSELCASVLYIVLCRISLCYILVSCVLYVHVMCIIIWQQCAAFILSSFLCFLKKIFSL